MTGQKLLEKPLSSPILLLTGRKNGQTLSPTYHFLSLDHVTDWVYLSDSVQRMVFFFFHIRTVFYFDIVFLVSDVWSKVLL